MKRTVLIQTFSLLLLSGWAWCQGDADNALPFHDHANAVASISFSESQGQQKSLPDAPLTQTATQADKFNVFIEDAGSPLSLGAIVVDAGLMHAEDENRFVSGRRPGMMTVYGEAALQKESSLFFGKYFYPTLLKQDPRYFPSVSNSILGRATYAVTRILITRKDSGGATLNTSYFLGTMTSSVVAAAYRPYWKRSNSDIMKDFGSSIGSDIGMNLVHEFWPGIRLVLLAHAPKFLHRQ